MDYFKASLELHKKLRGKLTVVSKVKTKNKTDLSLAYSPGVAEPCKEIAKNPEKVYEYTIKGNSVAVVSDGSSVLGLGNIGGLASIPVMEGKAALLKNFAGIDAFPICLETQETNEIINIVKNIAPVFGGINLEDIGAPKCFEIESALQNIGIPVMHDDQHGTAIVVLSGLINALKVIGKSKEIKIVINGAGAAGIATAKLLLLYGFKNLVLLDTKGAIYLGREDLSGEKLKIAEKTQGKKGDLASSLIGADVFIGTSKAGLVSKEMIKSMSDKAVVFALANPIPEIMPNDAKDAGAFIVATGRSDFSNQVNNVLAFPGIFRGALDSGAKRITDEMKLAAAKSIAGLVKKPRPEKIIPNPFDKSIVKVVAEAVAKFA